MADFMPEEEAPFDPGTPHIQIFIPWFYFDWVPAALETSVPQEAQDGLTLGAAYLRRKGKNLDPLLARYIAQCCKTPFGFFDILSFSLREKRTKTVRHKWDEKLLPATQCPSSLNLKSNEVRSSRHSIQSASLL